MIDFDLYLPTYKDKIESICSSNHENQPASGWKYFIPLVNISIENYKDGKLCFAYEVEEREKEPFAGVLFSTNLLSQVVVTYGTRFSVTGISDRAFWLQHTEEKGQLFPEIIKGLLGDWRFHICPSVLPLMIFYMDSTKEITKGFDHQDISLARQEWIKHRSLFEESVKWILRDLHHNMKILCNVEISPEEQVEIEKLMWHEFKRIDKELFIKRIVN